MRAPPINNGHPNPETLNSQPANDGLAAAASERGTFVTLAAAGRSSGVTTAITYEVRAGTSIDESVLRNNSIRIASGSVGLEVQCQHCDEHPGVTDDDGWVTVAEDYNQSFLYAQAGVWRR